MSETGIPGMGEILSITHKALEEIFLDPVEITEKVDGSFISFMMDPSGELRMRSKGQALFEGAPSSKMFNQAIAVIKLRVDALTPGCIYRGEYLSKPKHNSLAYNRTPKDNIAIFDIEWAEGEHADWVMREVEASRLGFEAVPVLYLTSMWNSGPPGLKALLETESFLGGQKIEGVVVKNFSRFAHGKPLMGKLVSEQFREIHAKEWKAGNPAGKDIVETLIERYAVEARWNKSIQHMRENGTLTNSPVDIGPLLKEIAEDIKKEEEDAIKQALWNWAWAKISRGATRGFPDYYKNKLMEEE